MRILKRLRDLLALGKPLIPREPVSYRAIGVVRNKVREPRTWGWDDVRSDLFLAEELTDALEGIEGFSHVIVLFHMHRVTNEEKPRLKLTVEDEKALEIGVFGTRTPLRPNPIGVAVVPLLWRRKNVLRVRGLDALDGSTVLDIKPYLPRFDSRPDATLPEWANRAVQRSTHG